MPNKKGLSRRTALTFLSALPAVAQTPSTRSQQALEPFPPGSGSSPKAHREVDLNDLFAMPGDRIITEEENFGIVNGHLSAGVNYQDVATLNGLYAPPYASSDFLFELRILGEKVRTQQYDWRPNEVRRKGTLGGIDVTTSTLLITGMRTAVLVVTLHNGTATTRRVPVQLNITGDPTQTNPLVSFDFVKSWGFARPDTRKIKTVRAVENQKVILRNSAGAVVVAADFSNITWEEASEWSTHWIATVSLRAGERKTNYIAIALGPGDEPVAACDRFLKNPVGAVQLSRGEFTRRTKDLLSTMPVFEASNPLLSEYYTRSLQHLMLNRWESPELVLNPYYSTGSIKGGCIGGYLWDFGMCSELLPLFDPRGTREHIKKYLEIDLSQHYLVNPVDGKGYGPTYMVNQEKIVGSVYHYVLHTGDVQFLGEMVAGKSVLEWVLFHASFNDDLSKPAYLIDYGKDVSHLELRHQYQYDHILPDINGMRYTGYARAAVLAALVGKERVAVAGRPAALKQLLTKQLWDPQNKWLAYMSDKGKSELRYTCMMFMLIGTGVLDHERELDLLSHLNEKEFLSEYGLHSVSKLDPAYDQADIDVGGGGSYVAFVPEIAEAFYKAGYVDHAEDLLKRTLWWAHRLPYWGDSMVANRIDYRTDTPLQCAVDASAGAQCVIFGMCGVRVEPNGNIVVNPRPPKFSPHIRLKKLRIRGRTIDISANRESFTVTVDGQIRTSTTGKPVVIPAVA